MKMGIMVVLLMTMMISWDKEAAFPFPLDLGLPLFSNILQGAPHVVFILGIIIPFLVIQVVLLMGAHKVWMTMVVYHHNVNKCK